MQNFWSTSCLLSPYIDGLMQERRNSIANALELRLSCTKPSICIGLYSKFFRLSYQPGTPLWAHKCRLVHTVIHVAIFTSTMCIWYSTEAMKLRSNFDKTSVIWFSHLRCLFFQGFPENFHLWPWYIPSVDHIYTQYIMILMSHMVTHMYWWLGTT